MRQSQISELEDVNNRSYKVSTLKRIAKALDLMLVVRFEEFGKVLPDMGKLDPEHLGRTSFKDDPVFSQRTDAMTDESAALSTKATLGRVLDGSARFSRDVSNVA
jgi:hypothetical protein